jgi:hypothetical protein
VSNGPSGGASLPMIMTPPITPGQQPNQPQQPNQQQQPQQTNNVPSSTSSTSPGPSDENLKRAYAALGLPPGTSSRPVAA